MIMNLLTNRTTYTEVNTNLSTITNNENIGVYQGSVMASTLYLIYTLDIEQIAHTNNHRNNTDYNKCKGDHIEAYVDDAYGIIISNDYTLWKNIERYIQRINEYYTANKLINNVSKTNIMIITKNHKLKYNESLTLDGKIVGHKSKIKILGTIMNDKLDWSDQVTKGSNSIDTTKNKM